MSTSHSPTITRAVDHILSTPRYLVRYMTDHGPKQRTFFVKARADEFADGKRWMGRAAKAEVVK